MKKVNLIMLVDDNEYDNEFHDLVIKGADAADNVASVDDSRKALEYFKKCFAQSANGHFPAPDLVFLDINMPAMTGFELLDKMRELPDPKDKKKAIKIFMLTGSLNPDDYRTAIEKYGDLVSGYRVKPLTEEMLLAITEQFF